jgi:16S rRNA (guanine527-N7)-methyltransferase
MVADPLFDPEAFALLNQHIDVSHETFLRLSRYHDLLLRWQSKVNLISPDTIEQAWHRHFLDALQLLPMIENLNAKIVDLGSGGGFPGMVIAIAGAGNMHLVESDTKKILFLREVARITDTTITLHHARIEDAPTQNADIITSRACSPLATLLQLASHYVSHETICLFHKGKNYSKEIEDALVDWEFNIATTPSVTDTQSAILKLTSIRKRQGA